MFVLIDPSGQAKHALGADMPMYGEYRAPAHGVHTVDPGASMYLPAGHQSHVVAASVSKSAFPTSHRRHKTDPKGLSIAAVPALQTWHGVDGFLSTSALPLAQAEQFVENWLE